MPVVLFFATLVNCLVAYFSLWNVIREKVPAAKRHEYQNDNQAFVATYCLLAVGEVISASMSEGITTWGITFALMLMVVLSAAARFYDWYQLMKKQPED